MNLTACVSGAADTTLAPLPRWPGLLRASAPRLRMNATTDPPAAISFSRAPSLKDAVIPQAPAPTPVAAPTAGANGPSIHLGYRAAIRCCSCGPRTKGDPQQPHPSDLRIPPPARLTPHAPHRPRIPLRQPHPTTKHRRTPSVRHPSPPRPKPRRRPPAPARMRRGRALVVLLFLLVLGRIGAHALPHSPPLCAE